MEIKAELKEPYTEEERLDFIVEWSHKMGYEIRKAADGLQAWGESAAELLESAKRAKYEEANNGARAFLESGNALFEFEEGKHIEATDGNIAKLGAYALGYIKGQLLPTDTVVWNTKEDETVNLTGDQISEIIAGLGQVQAYVWSVQYPAYVQAIEAAQTVEEVEVIEIRYVAGLFDEEVKK